MEKDYNVVIKVTTSCPGNCKCCVNRQLNFKSKNKTHAIFDLKLFEKICRELKKAGGSYICLSGGEPTMVPNLGDYIKIANENGLASRINTNGWGITEENVKSWLADGLDQIVLSVYGTTKKLISSTRGNDLLFERSQNALSVLKKTKRKNNFIFIIQTIILKDNFKNLPEIFKVAIDNKADLFWPSYLEDAHFLPEIRMREADIKYLKENIIPEMKRIVEKKFKSASHREKLIDTLNRYYSIKYDDYCYHDKTLKCALLGRHWTFYPGGVVDPCPGHEYFPSKYQQTVNLKTVAQIFSLENIKKNSSLSFDYCQYCPHGEHIGLNLKEQEFNEHSSKEILKK